ncbi:MAG: alpha-mannosyltransferase [Phyllobacteriaceae bacterium]|nr:alpha-mannosyltransferase [Phyllobacteriaceae bacterium]MBA93413.1 alpha-mannosyltransferase [Phyllobacteriaceae bacterium]
MRIMIASDAWHPQINGVVRVFETTRQHLAAEGHAVMVTGPDRFPSLGAPGYPEVRLALFPGRRLRALVEEFRPDAIHIPVEGPIGLAMRRICRKEGWRFTTSFHTRYGDYLRHRTGMNPDHAHLFQRWFHNAGARMMVQTKSLEDELTGRGYRNITQWGRGVDTTLFRPWRGVPGFDPDFLNLPRPVFMYLGRVAKEKSLEDFFRLDLPGSKLVVGGGPSLKAYKAAWPDVHFLGYRTGEDIARHLSAADVFVMPSRFETFGMVVLEALACGTPVAAYPVHGPADILGGASCGVLSDDLRQAALDALAIDRQACRDFALQFSWSACTDQFARNLVPLRA